MPFPVQVDSTWVNSGSVSLNAGELQRADAAMFAGLGSSPLAVMGGIVRHSGTSLAVTVDGSDVVTVQPGAAVIPNDANTTGGCYRAALNAAATGSLTARNATNGRIDLVVLHQLDTDVNPTDGGYVAQVEIIAGTPSATPAVPARPSKAVELARISVPATGGGSATVDSSKRLYAAALGAEFLVETAANLPTVAPKYQRARALDTGRQYEWLGSAWNLIPERAQAGRTTCTVPATSTRYNKTVTFPNAYAVAPVVTLSPEVIAPETVMATVSAVTTTGFTMYWYRPSNGDFTCGWQAVAVS